MGEIHVSDQLHALAALPPTEEKAPSTHWIGGWMVLPSQNLSGRCEEKNFALPEIELGSTD
jgi:hypothetical protein